MAWRMWWLLLLVPAAAGHGADVGSGELLPVGTYLDHVRPVEAALAPGEARNWSLAFGGPAGGAAFHEGWYWLLRADVEGDVRAAVWLDGQPLDSWTWATGRHTEVLRVPAHGFLRLELQNLGQSNATARFYYDQTCDCTGKTVPAASGPVWFNVDAQAGQEVRFQFTVQPVQAIITQAPLPGNVTVRAVHLRPDDGGFTPGQEAQHAWSTGGTSCAAGRWSGCFELAFTAQESGMQLVWVETSHDGDASWGTGVRPVVDVEPLSQGIPAALWLVPLALAAACRRR